MKRSMSDQRGKEEWLKMEIDKRQDRAGQTLWAETHGGTKCLPYIASG